MRMSFLILFVLALIAGASYYMQDRFPELRAQLYSSTKTLKLLPDVAPIKAQSPESNSLTIAGQSDPESSPTDNSIEPTSQLETIPAAIEEQTDSLQSAPDEAIEQFDPAKTTHVRDVIPQSEGSESTPVKVIEIKQPDPVATASTRNVVQQADHLEPIPASEVHERVEIDQPPVVTQQAAKSYIKEISAPNQEPVPVSEADHFVGQDQIIALLTEPPNEHFDQASETLQNAGPPPKPVAIINTLPELPDIVAREISYDEIMGKEQLAAIPIRRTQRNSSAPVKPLVIEEPPTQEKRHQTADRSENGMSDDETVTLADLLGKTGTASPDDIYYVRTVKTDDHRGIWGIIVDGLMINFASGITISDHEQTNTFRVNIPKNADYTNSDLSSSFLGRMVYQKALESHVYNYTANRMGQNPDLIYPGQELVIVSFKPQELIDIYTHFVSSAE